MSVSSSSQGGPLIACAIFKYFPFGGVQRDFVRIATALHQRGARLKAYVCQLEGPLPDFIEVVKIPANGISNHKQLQHFAKNVADHERRGAAALLLGFNKLPGLDWYYAADGCLLERWQHSKFRWFRWLPRYRTYAAMERAVFSPDSVCKILLISEVQGQHYRHHYATPAERMVSLPPGINKTRFQLTNPGEIREQVRRQLGISNSANMLLSVGSGFRIKGLDRTLTAMSRLPADLQANTHLFVVGQDKALAFVRQAKSLGVNNVQFLGGRNDVAELMAAADLLLHPAYSENTGTVLLESVTSGLPVICSERCGYARHVQDAEAGSVIPEPFSLDTYTAEIVRLLRNCQERKRLSESGRAYATQADWFSMPDRAAQLLLESLV